MPSGNLQIANATREDEGPYKCAAYNPVTQEVKTSISADRLRIRRESLRRTHTHWYFKAIIKPTVSLVSPALRPRVSVAFLPAHVWSEVTTCQNERPVIEVLSCPGCNFQPQQIHGHFQELQWDVAA